MRSLSSLAALIAATSMSLSTWPAEAPEFHKARIAAVSRGDVVQIQAGAQQKTVMLYGVTCQEPYTPKGAQAKRFTERLVQAGPVAIRTRFTQPKVRYIEVRLTNGRVLNHLLLLTGLGKLDTVSAFGDKDYLGYEEQAKSLEIGIWRPEDAVAPSLGGSLLEEETPSERFERRKRLERDAAFDLAYDRWRAMTDTDRAAMREKLKSRSAGVHAEDKAYLDELEALLNDIERELDTVRAEMDRTEQSIEESRDLEDNEVTTMYDGDEKLKQMNTRLELSEEARDIAYDEYGSKSFYHDEKLTEVKFNKKLIAKRRAELADEEKRIRTEHDRHRTDMKAQLDTLAGEEEELADELDDEDRRFARALRGTEDRSRRQVSRQVQQDELDAALQEEYSPTLARQALGTWTGKGSARTPVFDARQTVWAVDFSASTQAGKSQFRITVHREDDDAPILRRTDGGYPHENHAVLKGPGSFYLDIEAETSVSWSVEAIGFNAR